MRRLFAVALLLAACSSEERFAPSTAETNLIRYRSTFVGTTIPLAESCVGEPLEVHETFLVLVHTTDLPSGIQQAVFNFIDQGSTAIGLTTGTVYRFSQAIASTYRYDETLGASVNESIAYSYVLVGGGHRVVLQSRYHITLNPTTGELVVFFQGAAVRQCR
jgi:hypothetical protein